MGRGFHRGPRLRETFLSIAGGRARDPFLWDATNRSVRFTASNVCWPGFWRNWGVWGDRSPRSIGPVPDAESGGRCPVPSTAGAAGSHHPPQRCLSVTRNLFGVVCLLRPTPARGSRLIKLIGFSNSPTITVTYFTVSVGQWRSSIPGALTGSNFLGTRGHPVWGRSGSGESVSPSD